MKTRHRFTAYLTLTVAGTLAPFALGAPREPWRVAVWVSSSFLSFALLWALWGVLVRQEPFDPRPEPVDPGEVLRNPPPVWETDPNWARYLVLVLLYIVLILV